MSNLFENVPKDENVKILFEVTAKFGEYQAMFQKWYQDGIYGQSLIFDSQEISNISDNDLICEVSASDIVSDKRNITISRGQRFTFVNFNFEISE